VCERGEGGHQPVRELAKHFSYKAKVIYNEYFQGTKEKASL
jgi:hypothetical protein